MKKHLTLILVGGALFQIGSCASVFAPTLLALSEQVILSALLERVLGGL